MSRLSPEILLQAYAMGVFPMGESRHDTRLHWIDPESRGILPLDSLHVSRVLARTVRRDFFEVRIDTDFDAVIRACAEPGPGRWSTWINDEILALYGAAHRMGRAHSVECWREGSLAGGLYGISLGAAFFGESMFSREADASKVALVHLVARLRAGAFRLLDVQFVTPHLARFGAVEVPRAAYHRALASALDARGDFYSWPEGASGAAALQSITQTS
jgi:leucyl/phenylalanyl-tRNA--protein transferase